MYVDNDLSAYSGKLRPACERMLEDLAADGRFKARILGALLTTSGNPWTAKPLKSMLVGGRIALRGSRRQDGQIAIVPRGPEDRREAGVAGGGAQNPDELGLDEQEPRIVATSEGGTEARAGGHAGRDAAGGPATSASVNRLRITDQQVPFLARDVPPTRTVYVRDVAAH